MSKSSEHLAEHYNIAQWSEGYFAINAQGQACVTPFKDEDEGIALARIVESARSSGLHLPLLMRFGHILHDRVTQLNSAFLQAKHEYSYPGQYTCVYPIKVNQQRMVIEQLLSHPSVNLGLEAGSKAELMAIMALAKDNDTLLLCNGYKDQAILKLALMAKKMGLNIRVILEKPQEIDQLLTAVNTIEELPKLGIRVRLSRLGDGQWQNTGGEKSKFGLTANQVLETVAKLKQAQALDKLEVLHFHMGSQLSDIADIRRGIVEGLRYYIELHQLGVPINTVDIGGGLSVDYEGLRSDHYFSMNYSIKDYAKMVVECFKTYCSEHHLPYPDIVSENGRALSAHHAVLIVNPISIEQPLTTSTIGDTGSSSHPLLSELQTLSSKLCLDNLASTYQSALSVVAQLQTAFSDGELSLSERALGEQLFMLLLQKMQALLSEHSGSYPEIRQNINEKLADKMVCNFSLFQSVPDIWGISQVFPILPLNHLNQPLTKFAVVQDITCDSDGRIDRYVGDASMRSTLALPAVEHPQKLHLGIFLVGAYQEILGDIHNLFGDTNAVNVVFEPTTGDFTFEQIHKGDSLEAVLRYVNFDAEELVKRYQSKLAKSQLSLAQQQAYQDFLHEQMQSGTYFHD